MLNITKHSENGKAVMTIEGEINTVTAKELDEAQEGFLDGVVDLTVDMKGVPYITSAGLRVLLTMEQTMEDQGEMRVINVNEDVMDVFDVSGFTMVLNIE